MARKKRLQRAVAVVVAAVVLVAVVLLVRQARSDAVPTPIGIEIRNDMTLVLHTSCADDVSARVTETADALRIDDIAGDVIDGDCLGVVEISLSAPFSGQALIVDGTTWKRVSGPCSYGEYGPGNSCGMPA